MRGGPKTLGALVEISGAKSFTILFVLLLGVSALPLPTGGVAHVLQLIAVLLALQRSWVASSSGFRTAGAISSWPAISSSASSAP